MRTARYLRRPQIVGRLLNPVRRRVTSVFLPKWSGEPSVHDKTFEDAEAVGDSSATPVFSFSGTRQSLAIPVDWVASNRPQLWRYNLHYFDYLPDLSPPSQRALCHDWIKANPVGRGVGWDPYPLSKRIVNWCQASLTDAVALESLYQQCAYLSRNLETHVQGNHLIENAKALVVGGDFFSGDPMADKWFEKGVRLLLAEASEQVLDDGGHYERSPMYHSIVLEALLNALEIIPHDRPEWTKLSYIVCRMADFLHSMTHPGDRLALFNDSAFGVAPPPSELSERVNRLTGYSPVRRRELAESGYYCFRDADVSVIIDAGRVGPDHVPGHSHSDIFSFEMVLGTTPIVVDSGVYEYQAGPMRDYVRSAVAHNTLTVDGVDQVEVWDSFRVARRYRPEVRLAQVDGSFQIEAAFYGYSELIGDAIVHIRTFNLDPSAKVFTVNDVVNGQGTHLVESRIHLDPSVRVERQVDRFLLMHDGVAAILESDAPTRIDEGWYCPEFGTRHRNKVIVFGGEMRLPARLSYQIVYG